MFSECWASTVDVFKTVYSSILSRKKIIVGIIVVVYLINYVTFLNNKATINSSFSWSQLRVKAYSNVINTRVFFLTFIKEFFSVDMVRSEGRKKSLHIILDYVLFIEERDWRCHSRVQLWSK